MSEPKEILVLDMDGGFSEILQNSELKDQAKITYFDEIPENQSDELEHDLILIHEDLVKGEDCNVLPSLGVAHDTTALAVFARERDPFEQLRVLRMGVSEYLHARDGSFEFVMSQIQQILGLRNLSFSERLSYLLDVFYGISRFESIPDIFEFIIYSSTRIMGAERSSLFLLDEDARELYTLVAEGAQEIRIPIDKSIAGAVVRDKQTILISDPYNDPRFNPAVDKKTGFITRNMLCMPMITVSGRVVGVIQVLN